MKSRIALLATVMISLSVAGCQFDPQATAEIAAAFAPSSSGSGSGSGSGSSPSPSPSPSVSPSPSPSPSCFTESFQQPEEQISRSVDLLFVADTSGSMADNRIAVADGLFAFVGQLPSNVDYRIGMMLAHTSTSPYAGKLWSIPGVSRDPFNGYPYVLDSAQMSQATIQARLRSMMEQAQEYNSEEGEMGMYSLMQALTPAKLADSRAKGFFRNNAALAVIFISDENDVCAIFPNQPGIRTGLTAREGLVRARDCANGIAANSVIAAVRSLQAGRPFVFGAVTNNDLSVSFTGNEGYGWGYMEVIELSHGLSVNIESGDYAAGLAQIGSLVTTHLELILSRQLQRPRVEPTSIEVIVDGILRSHTYESATNEVHLNDAGGARSNVQINYCVQPEPCTGPSCGDLPGLGV